MNHIEFIEKHVRDELIKQGFTVAVAQGGHFRPSICTSACHRPVVRGGFSMTCYDTRSFGRRSSNYRLTSLKRNAERKTSLKLDCSDKGESRAVGSSYGSQDTVLCQQH